MKINEQFIESWIRKFSTLVLPIMIILIISAAIFLINGLIKKGSAANLDSVYYTLDIKKQIKSVDIVQYHNIKSEAHKTIIPGEIWEYELKNQP